MAIEPVKIPQNVYIEDRIVGPLTLRQLIITMAGGGVSYMIYGVVTKATGGANIIITVVSWIPLLIAFAFAFIKVNDLSLSKMILLSIEKFNNPPLRTWNPRTGLVIKVSTAASAHQDKEPLSRLAQAEALASNARIKELSSVLDRGIADTATPDQPAETAPQAPEEPVAVRTAAVDAADDALSSSTLPVDPTRIRVDRLSTTASPALSDLSVFRDIFTPHRE